MRVGYVLKRYPRYSETFVVNEILAHEAAGLDVEIFALRTPSDPHFQDLIARVRAPVTYIPNDSIRAGLLWSELREARREGVARGAMGAWLEDDPLALRQALLLAPKIRERNIDHLHAHFGTVATVVARHASRLAGIAYSFTAHAKDIFHESVEPAALRRKLRDAAAVVTVSDFNLRHLRVAVPEAAAKLERIYNGMDLDRFAYEAPSGRRPLILGVGRLVEKKGFGVLVAACESLKRRGIAFECRIIGAGECERELRAEIRSRGLEGAVTLEGPRPQQEVVGWMRRSAALAAPCIVASDGNRDGLPTALLEAMALGTPCVSTAVTGIPEIVRHGETGLVVPERDPEALADALGRLLAREPLRIRLARNARRLIEAEFDLAVNAARLRELFGAGGIARAGSKRARAS